MTRYKTGTASLYQDADGSLAIINTAEKLAWKLNGYLHPGRGFNDLLQAAQGKKPLYAAGCQPAPNLIDEPPVENQIVAAVTGDRYVVFYDRLLPQAKAYLDCYPQPPASPSPE